MLTFFCVRQESDISATKLRDLERKLKLKLGKDEDKEEIMKKVGSQLLKDKIVQLIDESKPVSGANLSVASKDILKESN